MTVRIRMSNARESVLRYEQEADLVAGSLLLWMAGAAIVIAVSYDLINSWLCPCSWSKDGEFPDA